MVGPPLGGFIATHFHWRYIFWINVPIGFLGVALVTRYIPDLARRRSAARCDSFLLSGLGLSSLVFGLGALGQGIIPAPAAAGLVTAGAAALCFYVRHARRTPHPIIDLDLLRVPTFHAAVVGGFLFRMGSGRCLFCCR